MKMDLVVLEKENTDPGSDSGKRRDRSSTDSENETAGDINSTSTDSKHRIPKAEDFTLLKPISRGAFGKVFIGCKKQDPDKIYAIKVMKKTDLINKNLIAQVTTERDALAMIHSPFVVEIYYSLQSEQNIYLVMEYLAGGDLKSLLAMYGYLMEDVSAMYVAEVTLALEHLHRKGIVHRDLKPDNMLIAGNGHLKLTDFGLSKVTLDVNSTPLRASQLTPMSRLDQYRTPGQILSLRSSLSFSAPRSHRSKQPSVSKNSKSRKSLLSLSSPKAKCGSSAIPVSPLVNSPLQTSDLHSPRALSVQQQSAACSILSPRPDQVPTPPPVKNLTPTLQDSRQWKHSSSLEASEPSESRISQTSTLFAGDISHIQGNQPLHDSSISSTDDVFSSTQHELMDVSMTVQTPNEKDHRELDCLSHDRASSRQESLQDSTPVLHRTDESVYNSSSARNLRSFREGSPLEDSTVAEKSDADSSPQQGDGKLESVPEENESLPSSQGSVDSRSQRQEAAESQLSRKRCYDAVTADCAKQAGSSHTGLTQEVFVMQIGDARQHSQEPGRSKQHSQSDGSDLEILEASMESEEKTLDVSDTVPRKIRITSKDSISTESDQGSPDKEDWADCQTPKDVQTTPLPGFNLSGQFFYSLVSSPETEAEDHGNLSMGSDCEAGGQASLPKTGPGVGAEKGKTLEDRSTENILLSVPQAPIIKASHRLPKNVEFKGVTEKNSPYKVRCMKVTNIELSGDLQNVEEFPEFKTPERQINRTKMAGHSDFITPQHPPPSVTQHKTPKEGVRRGPDPGPQEEERILGTPDYLAPEILRQEKHGVAVDWWSLGVCLFEFLTGLPPFNDETPDLVFSNILKRAISWPSDMSEMSKAAQDAINALLNTDPKKRPGAAQVKLMALFSKLDWDRLLETEPAFVPRPDDIMDTSYFDPKNTMQQLTISAVDM